jgi:hypothetical protein
MNYVTICLFTLILAGCNVSGPNFPADADETLDWGIRYARFGDEWWSIKNGEKWNKVSIPTSGGVRVIVKKGKSVDLADFGEYENVVQRLVNDIPYASPDYWGVYFHTDNPQIWINALREAWGNKKYKEIRLPCHDGCYYSAD